MTPLTGFVLLWAIATSLIWIFGSIKAAFDLARIPQISHVNPPKPAVYPRLSVIIPACNEEDTLARALQTLLDQDYPDLEVIVVNDRSTDATGVILNQMAQQDDRIVPIHIHQLPDGWLGKVNALHQGVQRATGDWLLFTDADIYYAPGVLRQSIAYSLHRQLDHLALLADFHSPSLGADIAISGFLGLGLAKWEPHKVEDPNSDVFIGVGAFNLIRRSAFEDTPGFEWLKMEVVDDIGLGKLMHVYRKHSAIALAKNALSVQWYPSLMAMMRGLEKNTFGAAANYNYLNLFGFIILFWGFLLGPVGIFLMDIPFRWVLPLGVFIAMMGYGYAMKIHLNRPLKTFLFFPFGLFMFSLAILRAGILCGLRGGVVWRGTHYPTAQLKAGQRIKMT